MKRILTTSLAVIMCACFAVQSFAVGAASNEYSGSAVATAAVESSNITYELIGEGETEITSEKFMGDTTLTNIMISSSVTKIGMRAFKNCTNLERVKFESGSALTTISSEAFQGCTSLEEIDLPSGVTTLYGRVFAACTNLENVYVSSNLTTIYTGAFLNCSNLKSLAIPSTANYIISSAFTGCDDLVFYVSDGSYAHTFVEDNGLPYCLHSVSTIDSYVDGTSRSVSVCEIPDKIFGEQVTTISSYAFAGAQDLEVINISYGITTIYYRAFRACPNLKTVVIPSSVTTISNSQDSMILDDSPNAAICCVRNSSYAWTYATNNGITRIAMNDDTDSETSSVYSIYESANRGTEYIIPEEFHGKDVVSVGDLSVTDVTKITIPKTVTELDQYVFGYCYNLTDIYIDSMTVRLDEDSFYGLEDMLADITVHCSKDALAYNDAELIGLTVTEN